MVRQTLFSLLFFSCWEVTLLEAQIKKGTSSNREIIKEDFASLKKGEIPKNWSGDGFVRGEDTQSKRPCLELLKTKGFHWLTLPAFSEPLSGDFEIVLEYRLQGWHNETRHNHFLGLHLEGGNGNSLDLLLDAQKLHHWPYSQARKLDDIKPGELSKLRLLREGDFVRVLVNDHEASAVKLDSLGPIHGMQIGLTGGLATDYEKDGPARLLSVKVASLAKESSKPKDIPLGTIVASTNGYDLPKGRFPNGWSAPGFAIANVKEFDKQCLEVTQKEGTAFLSLPKMEKALKGNFFVEAQGLTYGTGLPKSPNQEVHFRFEGTNAIPLHFIIDHEGEVRIGDLPRRKLKEFKPGQINRLRLIRRGENWQWVCNGSPDSEFKLPIIGELEQFRIGLTAGAPPGEEGHPPSRLFTLKVVSLGESKTENSFKGTVISHDFWSIDKGKLPEAWKGNNVAVSYSMRPYEQGGALRPPAIEISSITEETKVGGVEVPLKLQGNFVFETQFEFRNGIAQKEGLILLFMPAKGAPLLLKIQGDTMNAQRFPAVKIDKTIKESRENRLVVQRTPKGYQISLNEKPVGVVPLNSAPGPFDRVQIGLDSNGHDPSVRIISISALIPEETGKK